MRAISGRVSIRAQLTLTIIVLVVAVAGSLTYISYRAARRSLEEHAIASLEAATGSRAEALNLALAQKRDSLAAALKSVELACDPGKLNVVCARDTLRLFLKKEHARGLWLHYGRTGDIVVGDFMRRTLPDNGAPLSIGEKGVGIATMGYADKESGLELLVDFQIADLRQWAMLRAPYNIDLLANVDGRIRSLIGPIESYRERSAALSNCIAGAPGWAAEARNGVPTYVAYRPVGQINSCVTAEMPQSVALKPIERLRTKLAKAVVAFLLVSIVLAFFLAYVLTHPLKIMTQRVRQLKRGDFDSPVPIVGSGEIRDFSEGLASMAESLRSSHAALLRSEHKLKLAYDAARLSIWTYDPASGRVSWQGPGEPNSPIRSTSLYRALHLIDDRDRHAVLGAVRTAKQNGVFEAEYRLKNRDNELWISAWGQMTRDEDGHSGFMGVMLDSTSRRQAIRLISEREKLIATADMAASLAHEINNPLSSVVGALYLASSSLVSERDAQLSHYLRIAQQETDRITRIANQMLALYRKPCEPAPVEVRHLVQDVIAECRAQAEAKRQRLNVDLDGPCTMVGFPDELRHAFKNLLINAIEHSPAGQGIRIRIRRSTAFHRTPERCVRITVANRRTSTALGVRDATQAFTSTKAERGAGLGLWVTRSVVLKHGGTVRLRYFGTDRSGLCCAIHLPLRSPVFDTAHSSVSHWEPNRPQTAVPRTSGPLDTAQIR